MLFWSYLTLMFCGHSWCAASSEWFFQLFVWVTEFSALFFPDYLYVMYLFFKFFLLHPMYTHPMKSVSLACPSCHWICPSMLLWVSFFLWTLYYSENSSVKVSLSELQSNDLKIHSSTTYKVCQLWLHSVALHILFLKLNKTHTGHNVSFCFL